MFPPAEQIVPFSFRKVFVSWPIVVVSHDVR